jgi:hypothetical protein
MRDDPVEALVAFKEAHQAAHPGKDFDTIGWPDSVDWISMGGTLATRSQARQGSLVLDAVPDADDLDEPGEGEEADGEPEEVAADPGKQPAQVGLAAFGFAGVRA